MHRALAHLAGAAQHCHADCRNERAHGTHDALRPSWQPLLGVCICTQESIHDSVGTCTVHGTYIYLYLYIYVSDCSIEEIARVQTCLSRPSTRTGSCIPRLPEVARPEGDDSIATRSRRILPGYKRDTMLHRLLYLHLAFLGIIIDYNYGADCAAPSPGFEGPTTAAS